MCTSPLHKRNPYFGSKDFRIQICHDTEHEFINIPCGHCQACRSLKQNAYLQRVEMESKYNHLFFATLTYDNKHLPRLVFNIPKVAKKYSPVATASQSEEIELPFNQDGTPNAEMVSRSRQLIDRFENGYGESDLSAPDGDQLSDPVYSYDLTGEFEEVA